MADPKLAIVTGANRGMGFETCRQLGRLGYRVILTARNLAGKEAANKLKNEGLQVEPFQLDLTRPEDVARLIMIARRDWGQFIRWSTTLAFISNGTPPLSAKASVLTHGWRS